MIRRWALLVAWLAVPAWGAWGGEPAFTFLDVKGESVEVHPDPASGRALLLHFWATWCPDCVEDLANLAEVSSGCDRVRAIAVNAGDSQAQVEAYLSEHPVRLMVLRDPASKAWRSLDARGLPINVYWSTRGRETDLGPKTREQWRERLAQLGCSSDEPNSRTGPPS